jgi:hypothetical protein
MISFKTPLFLTASLAFLATQSAVAISFRPKTHGLIPPMRMASTTTVAGGHFFCPSGVADCKPDGVLFFNWSADGSSLLHLSTPESYLRVSPLRTGLEDISRTHLQRRASPNLLSRSTQIENGQTVSGCVGDLNGDGYSDVVAINRGYRHQLWINAGKISPGKLLNKTRDLGELAWIGVNPGALVNVSALEGPTLEAYQNGQQVHNTEVRHCAIGDLNHDGSNDIIVAHNSLISTRMSGENPAEPQVTHTTIQVFFNQGNTGTFRDVSRSKEWLRPEDRNIRIIQRFYKPIIDDWNRDGRPELLLLGGKRTSNGVVELSPHYFLPQLGGILGREAFFPVPSGDRRINIPGVNGGLHRSTDVLRLSKAKVEYGLFAGDDGEVRVYRYVPQLGNIPAALVQSQPGVFFAPGQEPRPSIELGGVNQIRSVWRNGRQLLILARQFQMESYTPGQDGLFRRDLASFGNPPTGSNEDLEVIDVNGDGLEDLVITGNGNARVALASGRTRFEYFLQYPNRSTMNAQSWGGCLRTGLQEGAACPLTAYLVPGTRNFAGLAQNLRNLPNGISRAGETFINVENFLDSNPKQENLNACLRSGEAMRAQDALQLSQVISNCDRPEACTQELVASCGAQWGRKSPAFQTSCSWFSRRQVNYQMACRAQCRADCTESQGNNADRNLMEILSRIPNYFGEDCEGNLAGACMEQCDAEFLDGVLPGNEAFTRIISNYRNVKFEPVTIEQGSAVVAFDYNGDGLLDILSEETYQGSHLYRNEGPLNGANFDRFGLVPAEKLPCSLFNRAIENGGVLPLDFDEDGKQDLLHIRTDGPLELWRNLYSAALEAQGNLPKYFEAFDLRPELGTKIYTLAESRVAGSLPSLYVGSIQDRPNTQPVQRDFVLERWDPPAQGIGRFLRRTVEFAPPAAGANALVQPQGRVGLTCKNHLTGVLSNPCPPEITLYRSTPTNDPSGSIKDIEISDINGDGINDLILGPEGWREIADGVLRNPAAGANFYSPVVTLLIGDNVDPKLSRFRDFSSQVQYSALRPLGYSMSWNVDGQEIDVEVHQVTGIESADFDRDGDVDLLITEFTRPVYLENQGPLCWQGLLSGVAQPGMRCLIDRSKQVFRVGDLGFNGVTGLKNYGSTVFDVNGDGRLDFVLRSAAEDQVFIQGP